jgi:glycosyltransferase involved in cell wall biosynthesis
MNLLVFSQYYPRIWNHKGIFIHNQNINLINMGVNVTVLAPTPWAPKILWFKKKWRRLGSLPIMANMDGVEVFYLRYPFLKPAKTFYRINATMLYQAAYRFITRNLQHRDFDLILARPLIPTGYAACLLSKKMKLPVVCEGTGSDVKVYPYYNSIAQKMYGKVLNDADKIIANAGNLSDEINAYAGRKLCDVVYRGVNTKKFKPFNNLIQVRESLKIAPNDRIILFVGNLSRNKGIFDLFSAFKTISDQLQYAKLYLIGSPSPGVDIKQLIIDKKLTGKVKYLGTKPPDELPLWYNACDFLVLPSYSEGMPNVVYEAMACSKPVVATPVGGISEVVENGVSGFLIEPGQIERLTEAITSLLTGDGLTRAMGQKALLRIRQDYVDTENVKIVIKLLENVIAEKKNTYHEN